MLFASRHGNKNVVQELISAGADTNKADNVGETPLYLAIRKGRKDIAQLLLEGGANPNTVDDDWGVAPKAPLLWAAKKGKAWAVQLLLDAGADPNLADQKGNTPLHWAAMGKYEKYHSTFDEYQYIVEILLAKGAEQRRVNQDLHTPLDVAKIYGSTEIERFFKLEGNGPVEPPLS